MTLDRAWRVWQWCLVFWLAGCGVYFCILRPVVAAQSLDGVYEQVRRATVDIEKISDQRLDARLSVVEDTLLEVKWVGRTVAGAMLLQLVAQMRERKRRT